MYRQKIKLSEARRKLKKQSDIDRIKKGNLEDKILLLFSWSAKSLTNRINTYLLQTKLSYDDYEARLNFLEEDIDRFIREKIFPLFNSMYSEDFKQRIKKAEKNLLKATCKTLIEDIHRYYDKHPEVWLALLMVEYFNVIKSVYEIQKGRIADNDVVRFNIPNSIELLADEISMGDSLNSSGLFAELEEKLLDNRRRYRSGYQTRLATLCIQHILLTGLIYMGVSTVLGSYLGIMIAASVGTLLLKSIFNQLIQLRPEDQEKHFSTKSMRENGFNALADYVEDSYQKLSYNSQSLHFTRKELEKYSHWAEDQAHSHMGEAHNLIMNVRVKPLENTDNNDNKKQLIFSSVAGWEQAYYFVTPLRTQMGKKIKGRKLKQDVGIEEPTLRLESTSIHHKREALSKYYGVSFNDIHHIKGPDENTFVKFVLDDVTIIGKTKGKTSNIRQGLNKYHGKGFARPPEKASILVYPGDDYFHEDAYAQKKCRPCRSANTPGRLYFFESQQLNKKTVGYEPRDEDSAEESLTVYSDLRYTPKHA